MQSLMFKEVSLPSSWPARGPAAGSPARRAGYIRSTASKVKGTAAEFRARHMKGNDHETVETARTPSPKKGPSSDAGKDSAVHSDWSAKTWDADTRDVLYAMVKEHESNLYERNLTIQPLTNKASVSTGHDIRHQQAVRRNQYAMSNSSSPATAEPSPSMEPRVWKQMRSIIQRMHCK